MDEYISFMAENGGRVIPKQPEPVSAPHEAPVIVEMRYMHMDLVEEAYWKRAMASRLARQCQVVAIRKAQERVQRQKQQEELQRQESERVKNSTKTAAPDFPQQPQPDAQINVTKPVEGDFVVQ